MKSKLMMILLHFPSLDLTGGSAVFYMACYSYISDVSEPKMRTKRIAFLDGLFPLGFYLGNSLSGIIKVQLGMAYNFGFGMLSAMLAVLYGCLFVKESNVEREECSKKQLAEELKEFKEHTKIERGMFCY